MKYPPDIRIRIFQDDGGNWRIYQSRNTRDLSDERMELMFTDGYTLEDLQPTLLPWTFETDHEAHIAVLRGHIEDISDEYSPVLYVDVFDPDDTDKPEWLRQLRELARTENK